jgi:hypothetical protein
MMYAELTAGRTFSRHQSDLESWRRIMADLHNAAPGVIHPDDVYRLDEFLNRMQWGKHAWQTARRRGLKPC